MPDILVIGARGIPDCEGGAEKHAEKTFPIFSEEGFSVTLLGTRASIRQSEFRGVRLRGIPTVRFAQTDKLIYHLLCLIYAAVTRPRLVHLQGLNSAIFLIGYKLVGLKVVLRYGSADHLHAKWGLLGRIGFLLCERQLRFADHVIVVSKKYETILKERYRLKRVTVIPNGIDPVHVSSEAQAYSDTLDISDKPYVFAVGRLTIDKDYETLLRAMSHSPELNARLVIAGGPNEKGYADRLYQWQGDRVKFLGCVERSLLAALYRNCTVFVNCSRFEGLSNAILEAISFERPIIVSDIAANREMPLRENSYFPAGDAEALRSRILMAMESPQAFVADKGCFVNWYEVFEGTEYVYRQVVPGLVSAEEARPRRLDRTT